jgi:RES domain-containing protein
MHVWRIATDTPTYASDDLSGKGAEITGGRWNRKGTPLLYASRSIALACLESVVNLGGSLPLPLNRYLVKIDLSDHDWAARMMFDPIRHVGWDAVPEGRGSIEWGTHWAGSSASLLAQVPSVVVPEEINVLINPRHAAATTLLGTKVRRWTFDMRLR